MGGVVEHVNQSPLGALLRLEQPGPGTAALFSMDFGEAVWRMTSGGDAGARIRTCEHASHAVGDRSEYVQGGRGFEDCVVR